MPLQNKAWMRNPAAQFVERIQMMHGATTAPLCWQNISHISSSAKQSHSSFLFFHPQLASSFKRKEAENDLNGDKTL